jgi:predicted CoA-binding protein
LAELPETPGVVDVVVPPRLGLAVAEDAARARIARIWFQPGAESAENIARAHALGLKTVAHACALVERKRW